MDTWQSSPVIRRADGSYVITCNGYPYHVPDEGEFAALWAEVDDWVKAHPERASDEPAPPEPTAEEIRDMRAKMVRAERDRRIAATDYLLMADYPVSVDALAAVKVYRQALRDLPGQPGFPWNGVEAAPWPELPAGLEL